MLAKRPMGYQLWTIVVHSKPIELMDTFGIPNRAIITHINFHTIASVSIKDLRGEEEEEGDPIPIHPSLSSPPSHSVHVNGFGFP